MRILGLALGLAACTASGGTPATGLADVTAVEATGEAGAYQFSVTVRSDETGCEQYADWWEVVKPDGTLIYRRVLGHSHPDEQPFTRGGGPVGIGQDDIVWVRAHMNPGGYGGRAMKGSVFGGFETDKMEDGFAANLATEPPLPDDCAF